METQSNKQKTQILDRDDNTNAIPKSVHFPFQLDLQSQIEKEKVIDNSVIIGEFYVTKPMCTFEQSLYALLFTNV